MSLAEKQHAIREWFRGRKPVRTFLGHLVALLTLGWDFPLLRECLKFWRSRPCVRARIERRRAALRYFAQLVRSSVRPVLRLVTKIVTLGRRPK